jgi:catechol 2,3-dioxygenase-like lactoylglutathione lyase family enzyme
MRSTCAAPTRRTTSTSPNCEPKYIGIAFHAGSPDDLEKLARAPGASPIESIDEPGGGKRVRLKDPDGFQVEVVHGMAMLPKIPVVRPAVNIGEDKTRRPNALYRVERGPSHVKRIGHFVVHSPQFEKTLGWYRDMLGFRCSDEVYADRKDNLVSRSAASTGARTYRPPRLLLHHSDRPGSTTCRMKRPTWTTSWSARASGGKGLRHFWGIGRHSLGSQVFDYWGDGAGSTSTGPTPMC